MKLSITEIKPNPNNPRIIKDQKFKLLVKSLTELPVMTELREVILDENNMIIGGNMRFRAAKEAGWNEISVKIFTKEDAERNNKLTDQEKTYEEYVEEITIKDNVSGGEWDWDILANEWDTDQLNEWGLNSVYENEANDSNEIDLLDKKVIEINFDDDKEMQLLYDELIERNYKCKILTL